MAEAEDVLTDAALHAANVAQQWWVRRQQREPPAVLHLADMAARLSILLSAVQGGGWRLRVAQPPAPSTLLRKLFRRQDHPRSVAALPATDGAAIWLPGSQPDAQAAGVWRYRTMALQQAQRAVRGSPGPMAGLRPLELDLYLLMEAHAADLALCRLFPGLRADVARLRREALEARPAEAGFAAPRREVERLARELLARDLAERGSLPWLGEVGGPQDSVRRARELAAILGERHRDPRGFGAQPLYKDLWTGELIAPGHAETRARPRGPDDGTAQREDRAVRSARLPRRPKVRRPREDEDDQKPGAWMVQTSQPHEHAEDPLGAQRPTDRDEQTAAEDHADSVAELPEARLVVAPGRPKEVLLSDDPPPRTATAGAESLATGEQQLWYPEWDWRADDYRRPGARVHLWPATPGPQQWVDRILREQGPMLHAIRRRFELLRARRVPLRRQLDGDDIDLEAWLEARADFAAGLPMTQRLYRSHRVVQRDIAISLLVDVSGSTDGWVQGQRRIVDVEREALLLVSTALDGLGQPYAIDAFSGEGPEGVTIRAIKRFDEPHGPEIMRHIAGLEPERYTRVGAAMRHVARQLAEQPARHRLLLLLSDGKPNDCDEYEGRYGVEDLRRAVLEARQQGLSPFCLTIDRQASSYLAHVFGRHGYALLERPERLPTVLLEWMKRLLSASH